MADSRRLALPKSNARSRITNGSALLPEVDGRSLHARRFRDLVRLFTSDLGGNATALSEGQRQLIRRACALAVELERLEIKFATNGGAKLIELETFQRMTNTMRRVIETLGMHKRKIARDVTPTLDQYLKHKAGRLGDVVDAEDTEIVQ